MAMHNKVAIVTGAGSGIGKAVTLALLRDGYRVALAGRRREPLEQTAVQSGGAARALVVPTDVSDAGAVQALFARVKEGFGRLDLLFNNAGIFIPGMEIDELSVEQWQAVVDVNLTGVFPVRARGLPDDEDPGPARRAHHQQRLDLRARPAAELRTYTATKHAITGLTKSISLDGRRYDIACGQIDIGNAHTEIAAPWPRGYRRRTDRSRSSR